MTTGSDPEPRLEEGEEWLTRKEIIDLEGVTERAITDRIASGYYRSKKEKGKRLIAYKRKPTGSNAGTYTGSLPETKTEYAGSETGSSGSQSGTAGVDSGKINELIDRVLEVSKINTELNAELRKAGNEILEQKGQLISLNGERANFTTAIEKRQDDKKRIERLEKELEELKAELEKAKTPWWKKLT